MCTLLPLYSVFFTITQYVGIIKTHVFICFKVLFVYVHFKILKYSSPATTKSTLFFLNVPTQLFRSKVPFFFNNIYLLMIKLSIFINYFINYDLPNLVKKCI